MGVAPPPGPPQLRGLKSCEERRCVPMGQRQGGRGGGRSWGALWGRSGVGGGRLGVSPTQCPTKRTGPTSGGPTPHVGVPQPHTPQWGSQPHTYPHLGVPAPHSGVPSHIWESPSPTLRGPPASHLGVPTPRLGGPQPQPHTWGSPSPTLVGLSPTPVPAAAPIGASPRPAPAAGPALRGGLCCGAGGRQLLWGCPIAEGP